MSIKVFHSEPFVDFLSFIPSSSSYTNATIEECDIIIHHELLSLKYPHKFFEEISTIYRPFNKKILFFILQDHERKYKKYFSNTIIVRTSARNSKIQPNEMVLPYIWESKEVPFDNSATTTFPTIGFCGLLSKPRRKIVRKLRRDKDVICDFIVRDKFWGGSQYDAKLSADFYRNMEVNQFIICNRGAGNFSMRFYQTLAAGRIPVLVNTDMLLPFSDRIPWNEFIVFEKSAAACIKKMKSIHHSGKCAEYQNKCRQIFEQYFSKEVYFNQLAFDLKEKYGLEKK